jgi:carboxymethylenebutenolidase
MKHHELEIETADGLCPAHVIHPAAPGPWPAVLMYMDGIGMRQALVDIATRIAGGGYYVLLPDLFYRTGHRVADANAFFTDPAARKAWMESVLPSATAEKIMGDTRAFLRHFERQANCSARQIGITGYCMGGRMAITAAGTFGERVACAAAFHPGGLATDKPDSPHLRAANMRGELYIAGAMEDAGFDDAQKERLARALTDAGVTFTMETYPAKHGWVPADTPVHDPEMAERHFEALFGLLERSLPGS